MSTHINKTLLLKDIQEFLHSGMVLQIPGSNDVFLGIGIGQFNPNCYFFTHNFYGVHCEKITPAKLIRMPISALGEVVERHFTNKCLITEACNEDDSYKKDIEQVLNWLHKDLNLKKFVTVSKADYEWNGVHPLSQLEKLLKLNGHLYGVWKDGKGVLGVSPEPLLLKEKDKWRTRSLAGTISTKLPHYEQTLLEDPKEREEHQIVVDDIADKLRTFNLDLNIEATKILNFGPIAHLCTEISFASDNADFFSIIKKLSPSAALGTFPYSALSKLKELDYYKHAKDNRDFGGVFGLVSGEISLSFVMIRNIYWKDDKVEIHSGTGIVANSHLERELLEVKNKRRSITQCFQ